MAFIQFVRVRDNSTGHEYDVVDTAVDPDAMTVLKDYPPNLVGIPRPAKHRTDKAGETTAAKPARKRAARKPSTTKATTPAATTKEK